nr:immunoglobulin light chain junction region [Macaca mulatta]MOV97133.1 immunoglobulin light chain junction region [Macaca mulatta]MOW00509.1 immunoglobulin light chain junction region [Macaca mulatta]MOW01021.1 immunoglobulin light chain junction region [Macaca mulatta]
EYHCASWDTNGTIF